MRKVLLCLVMVLFATWATVQAQEVITLTGNMEEELTPGSTYAFYDSGGPSANYGTSQSYTATFTCTGSITINFSSFATESSSSCYDWDYMLIYDGDATDGELLGRLQTGCASATITTDEDYVAQSGTLTIEWHSDGSSTAAGWEATITTEASAGPTCDKPESVEANDVTSSSATINWIGTAAAYNLQYKASADADWTLVKNLSGSSYQLTNLVSNTAYQVQVQAICGENTSGWRSASFNTLIGLPYAEHFKGTSAPSGWTNTAGRLQADGSVTLSGTTGWSFGAKNGIFDNHAYVNIWSTTVYRWLISPEIPIPEMEEGDQGYQLSFKIALTIWNSATEVDKTQQQDDRFIVLASNDGGANWTILREWNNTGSEYVYNDIAVTGEEVNPIDLSAYAGQTIKIAFYGESTQAGGDNAFHLDDVLIDETPTCLKPTGLHALNAQATSTTLPVAWTANSGETAWRLQYKPAADSTAVWTTLDIAANPYTITGLSAFTEYEVRVAAVCTEEDFTDYGKSIIAKTAAVVPFIQTFDTTAMPGEWKRYEALLEAVQESGAQLEASKNGWSVGLKNGVFNNEHLYLNIAGTDTKHWLVSPVIEMQAGYQLTFDLALTTNAGSAPTAVTAGEQNDDQFIVFISNNGGADWTALGTWGNQGQGTSFDQISTEGQTVKFDLSAYAGQSIMLAFYGESTEANGDNNLHISNVAIDLIPACERPLSITLGNVTGTTAEITWDADEEGTWEYGYVANPAADFAPTDADYTANTTDKIAELSELAETTDYIFFVRRACSETEKSEPLMKTFKTLQTPAELPYVGDFEETNGWLTFNGEYVNKWVRGTAVANGGTHALYISNDNGVSAAYTNNVACVVYATKTFYFPEAGMYSFSFDWMCNGEGNYDYLRVALVPASVEVEAATDLPTGLGTTALPEGWIALDGGSKLNLSSVWQTKRIELNIEQMGYYKVVLVWRDDTSGGTAPGAAVDNFKISRLACRMPNGLTLGDVTTNSAAFSWNDDEDGMTWEYACIPTGQEPTEFTDVDQNSLLVEGLDENTKYTLYLRKDCGDSQSEIVSLSFKTVNPYQITVNEGTSTSSYVPFYAYYAGSHTGSQFITPAERLDAIQWDSIKALTFYTSSLAAHDFGDARFDIYVGEVENTTMTANVPFASLTQVASNKALTIEDKMMYIEFDQMYQYAGGNLLVAINETTAGDGVSTTWLGVSATSGSARYEYSTYGPYSGSFLPKMSIDFKKGVVPPCATPKDFAALDTTVTTSSIELTWNPISTETTWAVRYREQGTEDWTVVFAAADTFLLEGLNHSTIYEAQVATQCDPEDPTAIGEYSASVTFATECAAVATIEQDFEGSLLCWSAIQDGNGYPTILSNYPEDAHSGSKFGYFASQVGYDPQDEYIVLPELISLEGMRLKFYARNDYEDASENATLVVGVMPALEDTANFVALDTIVLTSNVYNQFVVPFTAYTGEGKFVAIKMLAATVDIASALIDDVVVEAIPNCMEPNGLAADSLADDAVVLSWTPQGTEANWLVRYKKTSAAEWGEPILATNDTLMINGLEMGTSYDAQVAAWCDPTNAEAVSPYGAIISFTTLCGNITTLPWHADFENMAVNSIPTCWDNSASASTTLNSNPERIWGVYEYGDNKMLRMYNYYVSSGTALINMPAIVLPETPAYVLSFDYAHTATCGEMTVKISVNGGDFEALTPTYGKTSTGTDKDNPGEFTTADINLTPYAGDTIVIQFFSNANYGSGAIFLDNVDTHLAPTCVKPTGLAISDITEDGAKATWDNVENGAWLYAVALATAEMPADFIATTDTFAVVSELLDNSDYIFYLRKDCGEEGMSEIISAPFRTKMGPATVPYADDFEDGNNWMLINGSYTNVWAYGTAAHNGEGTHALYISNDNGASNAYSHSATAVYAVKSFQFEEGFYTFKYDWKANGESNYDLLCVALVPDSIELAATATGTFSLPTGWTKLHEANKLNLSSTWNTETFGMNVDAGLYNVVLLWRNDGSGGSQTPAAVDNFSIKKITCKEVSEFTVSNITATSATIGWTAGDEGQNAWQLVYTADPEFDLANVTDEEIIDVASNPYSLAELITDTLYTVYVRANCGEEDGVSAWASTTFRTAKACQTPDDVAAADITTNSASISWNTYGQTGFNLRYIHGTDTVVVPGVESPYALTNLDDADDYYVQVQVTCDEDNWSEALLFTTLQAPATIPYANDFETKNGWAFINGTFANAWAYGEAAHNGEGTHALYISNNGGTSNAYTTGSSAAVYATKLFQFEDGVYNFKYDWKANGESNYDLLCVALVPDTLELSATATSTFSLPEGWTALHNGIKLNLSSSWTTESFDLAVEAGLYKVVLLWRNDGSGGTQTPAAVDNISIKKLTCLKPINLTTSDVYAHSAKLSWSAGEEGQSAWQIALDTIAAFNPDTLSNLIDVNDTSYIFSDLLASHMYYVYVRANCGEDGASDWSAIKSFKTTIACPAPTGLAAELTPGNGTIATLTWNAGEAQAWTVEYSLNSNMSDSLVMNVTEPVANLTGLTAEATYYARVKADCGELDGQSAYSAIISFLPTNIYSIVVNDGTNTNNYVPIYGTYVDEGNTASQFIVPAESLQEILWDSITELTFYSGTATANWGAAEFEVYMTTTEDATLAALNDWDNLTQVMVAGNLSIVDNKMVVTLSEPFQYTGDNLLIGFKQTVAGSWVGCSWYGKNTTGGSIGGYGTGNNMTQRNFLPKMTIAYVPGQAPACMWATHLNVSEITTEGATIAWDDVEGANWEYALVMAGEEPVAFTATTNPIVLDNLLENTAYVFYLRNNCDSENSKTVSVAFSTIENIQAIPYETQFQDAATWKLANSDNAWAFGGNDANLFISNNGVNYGYDEDQASVSYATKLFDFDQAGEYTFTYFWKAVGEYNDEDGAIDFLRVALVPADVQLTAGVAPEGLTAENLPAGWMALDGGAALVATDVFTRQDAKINVPAGHYRVAFIWINDDSFTDGEPAAINCLYVKRGDATGLPEGGNAGPGTEAVKFIRDNRVYILVNGAVFDMTGRKVELK